MGGWIGAQFAQKRLPRFSELNAAAPDTPVFVIHPYQSAPLSGPSARFSCCQSALDGTSRWSV